MNKRKFDKLFEQGVMTDEDRNVVSDNMFVDENGVLIGSVDGLIDYKYTISYDIFKNSLTDLIIQKCIPPYCLMNTKPFTKYGLCCGGGYSEWEWFTKKNHYRICKK